MKVNEITRLIEDFAPLNLQESYDNSGLIVGDSNADVSGIILTVDITEEIIDEAIHTSCNLIIAHHPIIFSGLKKITGKNYVERILIKAIKNNIILYAAHTNLDNVSHGVNAKICEKLKLKNTRILSPKAGLLRKLVTYCPIDHASKLREVLFNAGAGKIGDYSDCSFNSEGKGTYRAGVNSNPFVGEKGVFHIESETKIETIFPVYLETQIIDALIDSHPYEEVAYDIYSLTNKYSSVGSGMIGELEKEINVGEFLSTLKFQMNTDCIRFTRFNEKKIKTVAVCGGSGSFLLQEAINAKADVFVSADFKYHQFFDAEDKIVIADIGHYESEQFTMEIIYEIIIKKIPTFTLRFSKINTNPINYLL